MVNKHLFRARYEPNIPVFESCRILRFLKSVATGIDNNTQIMGLIKCER